MTESYFQLYFLFEDLFFMRDSGFRNAVLSRME